MGKPRKKNNYSTMLVTLGIPLTKITSFSFSKTVFFNFILTTYLTTY